MFVIRISRRDEMILVNFLEERFYNSGGHKRDRETVIILDTYIQRLRNTKRNGYESGIGHSGYTG